MNGRYDYFHYQTSTAVYIPKFRTEPGPDTHVLSTPTLPNQYSPTSSIEEAKVHWADF